MGITVKEIAKLAGVSTATVSNVLTQKKYVSNELEQRVYKVVDELGYRPNAYARSLKTNRSYTLGVQVPDISNPFFSAAVKTIQNNLGESGYQIVLYDSSDSITVEEKNFNSMLDNRVDGIISIAPRMQMQELLQLVKIPLVVVDRAPEDANGNVAYVYSDNYDGSALVAQHMVEQGYNYFLCFAGPVGLVENAHMRVKGFLEVLRKRNISKDQYRVYYGDFTFQSGYDLMKEALNDTNFEGKRVAAFVSSDIMAWGAMEALKEQRIKMPKDMGIVGYDDVYFSSFLYPKLTTVHNPIHDMAVHSLKILIKALEESTPLSGITIELPSSLVVRETC